MGRSGQPPRPDRAVAEAGKYAAAVMSELPERNGWTIARHAGDRTPDKTQRLLNHASWDTFAAMAVVRRFAVTGLEEAARRGKRRRRAGDRGDRRNRAGKGRRGHLRGQAAVPGVRRPG